MSAVEIIKEIQKLSIEEQERVLAYLKNAHSDKQSSESEVKYVCNSDFDKAAETVLRERADLLRRLAQ